MSQFLLPTKPLWAWVYSVSDPQDSIKELMNCILRAFRQKSGGPMCTAASPANRKHPAIDLERSEYYLHHELSDPGPNHDLPESGDRIQVRSRFVLPLLTWRRADFKRDRTTINTFNLYTGTRIRGEKWRFKNACDFAIPQRRYRWKKRLQVTARKTRMELCVAPFDLSIGWSVKMVSRRWWYDGQAQHHHSNHR